MPGNSQVWRHALRDLIELVLLPLAVALLPAAMGMALARRLATVKRLYRHEVEAALSSARVVTDIADDVAWTERYRLMRLYDHADFYLWRLRRRGWYSSRVKLHGDWPVAKPFMAVFFHWGNGLWGMHDLRERSGEYTAVAAAPDRYSYAGRPVLAWYARVRTQATIDMIGGGLSFTGAAARPLLRAAESGRVILGLFDVPPIESEKTLEVTVLGHKLRFPRGLARIAALHAVPIVTFSSWMDPASGVNHLSLDAPQLFADEQAAADYMASRLEANIRKEPAYWHHWYLMR